MWLSPILFLLQAFDPGIPSSRRGNINIENVRLSSEVVEIALVINIHQLYLNHDAVEPRSKLNNLRFVHPTSLLCPIQYRL